MKTIFNTYIKVTSQKQADRLKQICIDNDLPIWKSSIAFRYDKGLYPCFDFYLDVFAIYNGKPKGKDKLKVTESEWLELLKQHQCTK